MADSLLGRMHPSSRTPRDTRDIIVAANRTRRRRPAELIHLLPRPEAPPVPHVVPEIRPPTECFALKRLRSEEQRVGKVWVSTLRCGLGPYHKKKTKQQNY